MSPTVVLDPGHGGEVPAGNSTPEGTVGPRGTREKELTLELARRIRSRIQAAPVVLTREGDHNLSLAARCAAAREASAAAFISLHFNAAEEPSETGAEIWIHPRAGAASRALAVRLRHALEPVAGQAEVKEGELALLVPEQHAPEAAACLVEAGYLTSPREEERLADPDYLDALAGAIGAALDAQRAGTPVEMRTARETFDIWHEVPLVYQTSGMSCWAAAAAMLVGWRDCIDIDAEEVAHGSGRWEAFRDGLEPEDVDVLARTWGLVVEPPRRYTIAALRELIARFGPLWIGEASPGLHVVTIAGMYGDGAPDGTFLRIADPWPIGRGERYTVSFREFARHLEAAASLAGIEAQVLHGDGRGRGARRQVESRSEVRVAFQGR